MALALLAAAACAPPAASPSQRPPTTSLPDPAVRVVTVSPQSPKPLTATFAAAADTLSRPTPETACDLFPANRDLLMPVVSRAAALPADHVPPDLQPLDLPLRNAYIVTVTVRSLVHLPLHDLLAASNEAGLFLKVASGYRSFEEQKYAYEKWRSLFPDRGSNISAPAGHSEHQLGTAIDFTTPVMYDQYQNTFHTRFGSLPEGEWLSLHAADYGFVQSYPRYAEAITGYEWEPWHYRYVGVDLARYLRQAGLTLLEYLGRCAGR